MTPFYKYYVTNYVSERMTGNLKEGIKRENFKIKEEISSATVEDTSTIYLKEEYVKIEETGGKILFSN